MSSSIPTYDPADDRIGCFFLDSGAHSLYTKHVMKDAEAQKRKRKNREAGYAFYETQTFWEYVDEYSQFIIRMNEQHKGSIDYYANVDVIFNPALSWRVLKYMEEKHKLHPVPVIHWGTPMEWIQKHLDAGYEFIGLGGLGQEAKKEQYYRWANQVYSLICPKSNNHLPLVRTHGFAMTAYDLLIKYPWWSVDSASWVKAGGFGMISVPRKKNGKYCFFDRRNGEMNPVPPYNFNVSFDSPTAKNWSQPRNLATLLKVSQEAAKVILDWLEEIGVPLGSVDKEGKMKDWGVVSHYGARMTANLRFYQMLIESLPKWPWAFKTVVNKGFF